MCLTNSNLVCCSLIEGSKSTTYRLHVVLSHASSLSQSRTFICVFTTTWRLPLHFHFAKNVRKCFFSVSQIPFNLYSASQTTISHSNVESLWKIFSAAEYAFISSLLSWVAFHGYVDPFTLCRLEHSKCLIQNKFVFYLPTAE